MTITLELIIELLLLGAAIAIAAYILPFVYVRNYSSAVIVGVLIAIINGATVWLLGQLGIGVNAASMTLAGLVLNIFSIMAVDKLLSGFRVRHFWGAAIFAILVIFINFGLNGVLDSVF
ncbi:MAG: phage holin family protein [Bacteroidetes bacterium]|nr:phage holin family protein [Bacteroidota bacterium]MCB0844945.1 phage holin family protein [Bacteroidota bacterium]MCB0852769.1 phage holin family protein [Bacteroidota bacterium]